MSDGAQAAGSTSYMRYLPAVFAKADDDFLFRYLKIFQKLLTGLADSTLDSRRGIQELLAAGVIGNLFYSRFSFLFSPTDHDFIPPISGLPEDQEKKILTDFDSYIGVPAPSSALDGYLADGTGSGDAQASFTAWLNDLLAWLAGWVDLVLDNGWSIDKKRQVIAEIMALYRLRGTPQGTSMLVNLLLDLPMQVSCYSTSPGKPVYGTVSVNVLNPTPPPILVNGKAGSPGTFVLRCAYLPGTPLVSGYAPWLFLVQVVLPAAGNPQLVLNATGAQQVQALLGQLATVLDAAKPAGTHYQIQILGGMSLQPLPYQPILGVNAVLGTTVPSS
jgi:hypothetical protein